MTRLATIRRMLATMLLALWWGGFTFYAARGEVNGPGLIGKDGLVIEQVFNFHELTLHHPFDIRCHRGQ